MYHSLPSTSFTRSRPHQPQRINHYNSQYNHIDFGVKHNNSLDFDALAVDYDPQTSDFTTSFSFSQTNIPFTAGLQTSQLEFENFGSQSSNNFSTSDFNLGTIDHTDVTLGNNPNPWPLASPVFQPGASAMGCVQHQAENAPFPLGFATTQPDPLTLASFPLPRQAEARLTGCGDAGFRCPRGCNTTIRRPGDFRRHMKKHAAPEFKCIVKGCNKEFYRLDKLRVHVKVHGHNL